MRGSSTRLDRTELTTVCQTKCGSCNDTAGVLTRTQSNIGAGQVCVYQNAADRLPKPESVQTSSNSGLRPDAADRGLEGRKLSRRRCPCIRLVATMVVWRFKQGSYRGSIADRSPPVSQKTERVVVTPGHVTDCSAVHRVGGSPRLEGRTSHLYTGKRADESL